MSIDIKKKAATRWSSWLLLAATVLSPGSGAWAGAGRTELPVEVLDRGGEAVVDLKTADLEVVEEGAVIAPLSLEPIGEWRVVVFLERTFSTSLTLSSGALEVGRHAEALTALGPVEVVLGGEEITRSLPPTRDPKALEQALSWIALREGGLAAQLGVRERFLESPEVEPILADPAAAVSATAGRRLASLARAVRSAVESEAELIEADRVRLLGWLAEQGGPGADAAPSVLLYVSSGWDEHDLGYYKNVLKRIAMPEAADGLIWPDVAPSLGETSRAIAALGWVVLGFSPSELVAADAAEGDDDAAARRKEDEQVETVIQGGREIDRTMLKPSLDPRDLFRRRGKAVEAELVSPLAPLERLADDSSGAVAADGRQLAREIERLAGRYRLSYESAAVGDAPKRVEVRAAPAAGPSGGRAAALEISAPRWVSSHPPRLLSTVRARRMIAEEVGDGDLMISAVAGADGKLRVEWLVESLPEGALRSRPLRVTVAAPGPDERPVAEHTVVDAARLEPVEGVDEAFVFEIAAPALLAPEAPGVVVLEDLERGLWGSAHVRFDAQPDTGSTAASAGLPSSWNLPAPKAVHLVAPRSGVVMGPTDFETVVSDSRVARVDFLLDGEVAVSRSTLPFSARLDLGRLPRTRQVEALAYAGDGTLLARDALVVNQGSGNFRVRIVTPQPGSSAEPGRQITGPVEVEAAVRVPRGSRLEQLDFFWKRELAGTRYARPFRQTIVVPSDSPAGFVRVVGRLSDGSTAEDVVFLNSPRGSERLRVELVELYTVVTDSRGRPVQGLDREDFSVVEDGKRQEIATFGDAGDQPLTVGVAIDSSASMFVKLPDVQNAAARFLDGLTAQRDRAFVVGFGDEAFLQRDTTSDLSAARRALYRLQPAGRTSIWQGIVYSLVQLQGVPGKKALIVYSDGADEDPDFSFRTCLEFARRVGAPLYVIVSNDEIYRTEGKGLTIRGFMNRLETLTRSVGGRVFVTRVGEDLEAIYREVDREIRSQYLLGYYAEQTEEEAWREVRVRVEVPGATARTVAGYYR